MEDSTFFFFKQHFGYYCQIIGMKQTENPTHSNSLTYLLPPSSFPVDLSKIQTPNCSHKACRDSASAPCLPVLSLSCSLGTSAFLPTRSILSSGPTEGLCTCYLPCLSSFSPRFCMAVSFSSLKFQHQLCHLQRDFPNSQLKW